MLSLRLNVASLFNAQQSKTYPVVVLRILPTSKLFFSISSWRANSYCVKNFSCFYYINLVVGFLKNEIFFVGFLEFSLFLNESGVCQCLDNKGIHRTPRVCSNLIYTEILWNEDELIQKLRIAVRGFQILKQFSRVL